MSMLNDWNSDKSWILAAGVVIGTAGLKLLTTKEAKKAYVHMAAAGLEVRDYLFDKSSAFRAEVNDIYQKAKELKAQNDAEADVFAE